MDSPLQEAFKEVHIALRALSFQEEDVDAT